MNIKCTANHILKYLDKIPSMNNWALFWDRFHLKFKVSKTQSLMIKSFKHLQENNKWSDVYCYLTNKLILNVSIANKLEMDRKFHAYN